MVDFDKSKIEAAMEELGETDYDNRQSKCCVLDALLFSVKKYVDDSIAELEQRLRNESKTDIQTPV